MNIQSLTRRAGKRVFLMLPHVLSIAALVMVARKADYPRALLVPWFKGQR